MLLAKGDQGKEHGRKTRAERKKNLTSWRKKHVAAVNVNKLVLVLAQKGESFLKTAQELCFQQFKQVHF